MPRTPIYYTRNPDHPAAAWWKWKCTACLQQRTVAAGSGVYDWLEEMEMHRLLAAALIGCTLMTAPALAQTAVWGHPRHRTPGSSDGVPSDGGPTYVTLQGAPRGSAAPVPVRPYAYGWFGAQPRYHCVRHFGYYRNYTQWTAR